MGVYIKGMEMPDSCQNCMLSGFWDADVCNVNGKVIDLETRPDWCPLVEVPTPHGDLVDLDEIEVNYWEDADGFHESIETTIVIEAEGE